MECSILEHEELKVKAEDIKVEVKQEYIKVEHEVKEETTQDIKVEHDVKLEVKEETTQNIKVEIKEKCTEVHEQVKHEEIKQEIKDETDKVNTLEANIDEALKNGHLGIPVDADYLREDAYWAKKIKLESQNEDISESSNMMQMCSGSDDKVDKISDAVREQSSSKHHNLQSTGMTKFNDRIGSRDDVDGESHQKVYECCCCSFIAIMQLSLRQHQIIHATKPPFHCPTCEFQTCNSNHFNYHILTHNRDKPYCCPVCTASFCSSSPIKPNDLQRHLDLKHPNGRASKDYRLVTILKCQCCSFIATKQLSLDQHQTIHTNRQPYQCISCSYQTTKTADLNHHILAHNDDRPQRCTRCSACFSDVSDLKNHIDSRHADVLCSSGSSLYCDQCTFRTYVPLAMKQHMEDHSVRANAGILECQQCKFIATKQLSLDQHQIIHTTNRPYQCTQCKYQTSYTGDLNNHILAHNKDKPHQCTHCTACFSHPSTLKCHIAARHCETPSVD